MIWQFNNVADSHHRFVIWLFQSKLYSILIIRLNRKPTFLIAMKSFEMKWFKWKQVFFASSLNQVLDSLLISSDDLGLKPELLQASLPLFIEVLQIYFIKSNYHTLYFFGCKDNKKNRNSQKIESIFLKRSLVLILSPYIYLPHH